ncbi:MAG: hypothetical protein LBH43_21540 [Treponema sp.]|jgi:SOS-response transcriptional repressor LexA|nr:hypothetical protein [Treponema sp.]
MRKACTPRKAGYSRKTSASPHFGFAPVAISKEIIYPNQVIQFPLDAIKGRITSYCSLTVRGSSMTGAGIRDGDNILFQKTEAPKNGAVMLVRYKNKKTVKRVRIKEGAVFLCWDDGSNKQMMVDSEDYEIQGKLAAIERKPRKR